MENLNAESRRTVLNSSTFFSADSWLFYGPGRTAMHTSTIIPGQLIDIEEKNRYSCFKGQSSEILSDARVAIGATINGIPTVCEGSDKKCYEYKERKWSVASFQLSSTSPRLSDAKTPDGFEWWIIGGSPDTIDVLFDGKLTPREIRIPVESTTAQSRAPFFLTLNRTHFVYIVFASKSLFFLNKVTGAWTERKDFESRPFQDFSGIVTKRNGEKEIVSFGMTSETPFIYSVLNRSFRDAEGLFPSGKVSCPSFDRNCGVQYKNTFLMLGEYSQMKAAKIFMMNVENETFEEVGPAIHTPSPYGVTMLVPSQAYIC